MSPNRDAGKRPREPEAGMVKVGGDVSPSQLRRSVTLKDVALAAGVTPMTVSNVLNGRVGQVSADTRRKVVAAIESLGYRPHAVGRRLRGRRTLSIGVLILDDVPQFLGDPFTTQVVAGLANVATDSGYSLVLQGMRSDDLKDPPLLAQLETDGMCALLSGPEPRRRALIERLAGIGLPLVLIQEQKAPAGVCCIRQDDRGGARAVAKHLLERGARRLMMLVPSEVWPAITMRERGVRAECRKFGAELSLVRCGDESVPQTQDALERAIAGQGLPDAIVGGNDRMAMAALKWLDARNIPVPARVKVSGFNGFDLVAYAATDLTTARSPAYEMGRRAGEELLRHFAEGAFSRREIVLPVAFCPASST